MCVYYYIKELSCPGDLINHVAQYILREVRLVTLWKSTVPCNLKIFFFIIEAKSALKLLAGYHKAPRHFIDSLRADFVK